ncbi:MAG: aminoacetone oxidase family FAD-binding enzyme [Prevotella sp.]
MNIAIIGAGAAGCFAAIHIKRWQPEARVTVYESGRKALAKVAVTGGGRCNLTNSFAAVTGMEQVYPRGHRLMKRLLREFSQQDTCQWFENEGVALVTQEDECVFPASQDAMEIVGTLLRRMKAQEVELRLEHRLTGIHHTQQGYRLAFSNGKTAEAQRVLIATGGSPKQSGLSMLDGLQIETVDPVPSLFSVCVPGHDITTMAGTVVNDVRTTLCGTRLQAYGALLITHQGLSGPAILKLSSRGARLLNEQDYRTKIAVNWFGNENEEEVVSRLISMAAKHPQKQLQSVYPTRFTARLWLYLLQQCHIRHDLRWAEAGAKGMRRMAAVLTHHEIEINGKNKFKEEFVTCGGVALSNINPSTMECREHPGLFFAGEVLDVDAVTGGFNLQAAWSMGYVAARHITLTS